MVLRVNIEKRGRNLNFYLINIDNRPNQQCDQKETDQMSQILLQKGDKSEILQQFMIGSMEDENGISSALKIAINQHDLSGAAQKLKDVMVAAEQAHFDVHIKRKWRSSRQEYLNSKLQNQELQQEYVIPLLDSDEKQEFPNRILYKSFNVKHHNRYIPGNFIHRQFAAYCKYFISNFYQQAHAEMFMDRTFDNKDQMAVRQFIEWVQQTSEKIGQKYGQEEGKEFVQRGKKLLKKINKKFNKFENQDSYSANIEACSQNLKKFRKGYENRKPKQDDPTQKSELPYHFNKYLVSIRNWLQGLRDLSLNAPQGYIDGCISTMEQKALRVQKLFFDKCRDHTAVGILLQRRIKFEAAFRNKIHSNAKSMFLSNDNPNINGYREFYTQNKSKQGQRRSKQVDDNLNDVKKQQFCNIRLKNINYGDESLNILQNFALGRLSVVKNQLNESKFWMFKPFIFTQEDLIKLQQYRKENENPLLEKKPHYHPEQQILRKAVEQIQKLQISQIPNISAVVIDLHTQLQLSSGDSATCCLNQVALCKQKIAKMIRNDQEVFIRVSYSEGNRKETDLYVEHRIEGTVISENQQDQYNHHIQALFDPSQVLISPGIVGSQQILKNTCDAIRLKASAKLQKFSKEVQQQKKLQKLTPNHTKPFVVG